MFLPNEFSLKLMPSQKYLQLLQQYTSTRNYYVKQGGRDLNDTDKRFREELKNEWQKMQGVKRGRRYPSVEALYGKSGSTLLFNQDHADVWNYLGAPVMVTSMPYVATESQGSAVRLRAFEAKHGLICQRMFYPGWHCPTGTALDVWMLA